MSIIVILKFIGKLQQMSIGKYLTTGKHLADKLSSNNNNSYLLGL